MNPKTLVAALAIVAAAFTNAASAQVPSIALDPGPNISPNGQSDFLGVGNSNDRYWVDNDVQDGTVAGDTKVGRSSTVGPNGEVAFRTQWSWPIPDPDGRIKAYPSVLKGAKPGFFQPTCDCPGGKYIRYADGTNTRDTPDGPGPYGATPGSFFPLQLPLAAPIDSSFIWSHNVTPNGSGHLAYDILLQNTPVQQQGWNSAGEISYEVMIELNAWNYPANEDWYSHTATIGGRVFRVYDYSSVVDWRFIVFVPQDSQNPNPSPQSINNTTLDLAQFVTHVTTYPGWTSTSNQYVVSAELGVETTQGGGDLTVWNYRVWQGTATGGGGGGVTGTKFQAEDPQFSQFSGTGMSVHTDLPGYEGTGFLAWFSDPGDQMTMTLPIAAVGTYDVNIRYRSLGTQQNNVIINGGAPRSETFASGDAFATKTLTNVPLQAGSNTIAITKDWGWIGVDYVEIVPAGVARIQAENAQFSGPGNSVHTDVPGYDGTGFVAWFSDPADQLSLSFPNVAAGNYDINIRYRSLGSQQNNVVINGGAALSKTFASGDAFATMTLSAVALQAGTNTIAFTKDWGWIGIDYVEIVPR